MFFYKAWAYFLVNQISKYNDPFIHPSHILSPFVLSSSIQSFLPLFLVSCSLTCYSNPHFLTRLSIPHFHPSSSFLRSSLSSTSLVLTSALFFVSLLLASIFLFQSTWLRLTFGHVNLCWRASAHSWRGLVA